MDYKNNNTRELGHIFPTLNNHLFDVLNDIQEQFFNDSTKRKINNFPPTNITYNKKEKFFEIKILVAGYNEDKIKIEMEKNDLIISYNNKKEITDDVDQNDQNEVLIFKGISEKKFLKEYHFSKKIENIEATIDNGILLVKVFEETDKENKKININIKRITHENK